MPESQGRGVGLSTKALLGQQGGGKGSGEGGSDRVPLSRPGVTGPLSGTGRMGSCLAPRLRPRRGTLRQVQHRVRGLAGWLSRGTSGPREAGVALGREEQVFWPSLAFGLHGPGQRMWGDRERQTVSVPGDPLSERDLWPQVSGIS